VVRPLISFLALLVLFSLHSCKEQPSIEVKQVNSPFLSGDFSEGTVLKSITEYRRADDQNFYAKTGFSYHGSGKLDQLVSRTAGGSISYTATYQYLADTAVLVEVSGPNSDETCPSSYLTIFDSNQLVKQQTATVSCSSITRKFKNILLSKDSVLIEADDDTYLYTVHLLDENVAEISVGDLNVADLGEVKIEYSDSPNYMKATGLMADGFTDFLPYNNYSFTPRGELIQPDKNVALVTVNGARTTSFNYSYNSAGMPVRITKFFGHDLSAKSYYVVEYY